MEARHGQDEHRRAGDIREACSRPSRPWSSCRSSTHKRRSFCSKPGRAGWWEPVIGVVTIMAFVTLTLPPSLSPGVAECRELDPLQGRPADGERS
jgi:hypothetical protein